MSASSSITSSNLSHSGLIPLPATESDICIGVLILTWLLGGIRGVETSLYCIIGLSGLCPKVEYAPETCFLVNLHPV